MDKKISGIGYCFGGKHHKIDVYKNDKNQTYLMIDETFRGELFDKDITNSAECGAFWKAVRELEKTYTEFCGV